MIAPNGLSKADLRRAESSWATMRIVGRASGFVRTQDRATTKMNTTCAASCPSGASSLWSNKSLSSSSADDLPTPSLVSSELYSEQMSPPGNFPIKISIATTPKLYTSHLVVTLR